MSRRTLWDSRLGAAATLVIAPVVVLVFLLTLPVTGPLLAVSEARADRRKRAAAVGWPCGRCGAPLGLPALERADAVFAAYVHTAFEDGGALRMRMVRELDACCPTCDAGHRWDRSTHAFVLLPAREYERTYAAALGEVGLGEVGA